MAYPRVMMKIGGYSIDWKLTTGVLVALAGWVVVNGPNILPTLPLQYQKVAGNVVGVAGLITLIFADKPQKA